MKRSALRTYTPLRRTTRLAAVNPERKAAGHLRRFGETHDSFVRSHPCVVQGHAKAAKRTPCKGRLQAAHACHAGMGNAKGDKKDLFPACWQHHAEADGRTKLPNGEVGKAAFEALYGIDLDAIAAELWRQSPENPANKPAEAPPCA